MKRLFFLFLLLSISLSSIICLGAVKLPGLAAGDKTQAFDIYDLTGPNKGKNLCYV